VSRTENLEHLCRQGRRCKGRTRDDEGGFHGSGVERPNSLCRACEEYAFEAIRELATDYGLLASARAEERSTVSGPKVSGSSELPIPIPLGIDTLMTQIDDEAARWARRLPGDDPYELHPCLTVICSNLGTLVDLPPSPHTIWVPHPDGGDGFAATVLDGCDGVLRLANLHRRAQTLLGIVEMTTWLNESCHICGLRTLTSNMSRATIQCRNCRNVWDQDEFARLNNPLAAA
jgi:hypothetical protein